MIRNKNTKTCVINTYASPSCKHKYPTKLLFVLIGLLIPLLVNDVATA